MEIRKLDDMITVARTKPKNRLIVAFGQDAHTLSAVAEAIDLGIIEATVVGDTEIIKEVCREEGINSDTFEIVHESVEMEAGLKACDLINNGHGNMIMKGLISSDNYMRCLLNKERGIMIPNGILSHVTVVEPSSYHKLLTVGDVAVIPLPNTEQKVFITNQLIKTAHRLGIEKPKVAVLAATEKASSKMPACADAAILVKMAEEGKFDEAIVAGPLALDLIVDKESAEIKGVKSEVCGDADCILFPNIESGNVFYKAMTKMLGCELAANVVGAKVPAILSSRGDSAKTKLYSIALATLITK